MGFSMELVRARRRINELEADIADLQQQLSLGAEKPSVADIVKESAISIIDSQIVIDLAQLNIPFTVPPQALPIMMIPDTNSMDGIFDYGNNNLYIKPVGSVNHQIMVNWIAQQWIDSKGLQTVDAVYRIMVNEVDRPDDFSKPHLWYAIHRLVEVGVDAQGRYFWFAGVNSPARDQYKARDENILWLNLGVVY